MPAADTAPAIDLVAVRCLLPMWERVVQDCGEDFALILFSSHGGAMLNVATMR